MMDFLEFIEYLDSTHIYNFSEFDYNNSELKMYYFTFDDFHKYITVSLTSNDNKSYEYSIGDLYIDFKNNKLFEDSPEIISTLNKQEYLSFKKVFDKSDRWSPEFINTIFKNKDKSDLAL